METNLKYPIDPVTQRAIDERPNKRPPHRFNNVHVAPECNCDRMEIDWELCDLPVHIKSCDGKCDYTKMDERKKDGDREE